MMIRIVLITYRSDRTLSLRRAAIKKRRYFFSVSLTASLALPRAF